MAVEVFIHKMSEHMESAEIVQWLAREGDRVEKFQPILEVMTDKVTAELESPESGVLMGIRPGVTGGALVPVGETIAFIVQPGERVPVLPPLPGYLAEDSAEVASSGTPRTDEVASSGTPPNHPPAASAVGAEGGGVRSTPAARWVARELGVEISRVPGTGPGRRVTEEDVRAFVRTAEGP